MPTVNVVRAGKRLGGWAYDLPMNVRSMRPDELDVAVSVWREANIARGAPHGPERTARIRETLSLRRPAVRCAAARRRGHGAGRAWKAR